MKLILKIFTTVFSILATINAIGMDARDVFKQVSSSVFVVIGQDIKGQVKAQGSGVQIDKNRVITNCHVVDQSTSIVLIQKDKRIPASIKSRDNERDLCLLATEPLNSPTVKMSASSFLEQGQIVYAIGAPMGLELTISDGVVSGLRKAVGGFIIQTSAAISPGSSGGGLFDANGKLIGITTFQYVKGQNLNFALPAEWIAQVDSRESFEARIRKRRNEYKKAMSAYDFSNPTYHLSIIKVTEKYLKTDPNHIEALFNLGNVLTISGQAAAAESIWVKMTNLPINDRLDSWKIGWGAVMLSQYYEDVGKKQMARETAATAITYVPIDYMFSNYWQLLNTSEHYRDAIETFRVAVAVNPKNPEGWAYLGGSYMNTKDFDNAIKCFQKATNIKPDYEWAWLGYAVSLRSAGRDEEFEKVFKYLNENQPVILEKIINSFGKKK